MSEATKLIEEVLTGEAADDGANLTGRAAELLAELDAGAAAENRLGIVPAELAATILRTLNLPEIAQLRPRLLPECRVYGRETSANGEILTSGTADAVARDHASALRAMERSDPSELLQPIIFVQGNQSFAKSSCAQSFQT